MPTLYNVQVARQILREFREDAGVQKKAIYNAAYLQWSMQIDATAIKPSASNQTKDYY